MYATVKKYVDGTIRAKNKKEAEEIAQEKYRLLLNELLMNNDFEQWLPENLHLVKDKQEWKDNDCSGVYVEVTEPDHE
jgi:hypothetical protein